MHLFRSSGFKASLVPLERMSETIRLNQGNPSLFYPEASRCFPSYPALPQDCSTSSSPPPTAKRILKSGASASGLRFRYRASACGSGKPSVCHQVTWTRQRHPDPFSDRSETTLPCRFREARHEAARDHGAWLFGLPGFRLVVTHICKNLEEPAGCAEFVRYRV